MAQENKKRKSDFAILLKNDICPYCKLKIELKKQVGGCVYAQPCQHRLYQGRLDYKEDR